MQAQGKASGTVAASHTTGTQPAQDPHTIIKESHSARPGDPPLLWKYHGEKSGGKHSAGEKGGVHALVNANGDYIDLKGNIINPLNPDDQAKDLEGRMFTVIRDKDEKIIGVSYGRGQDLPVTQKPDGTLMREIGVPTEEFVAKVNPLIDGQATDEFGRMLTVKRDKDEKIIGVSYGRGMDLAVTQKPDGTLVRIIKNEKPIAKIDRAQLALIKQEAKKSNVKGMTEYTASVVFGSRHPGLYPAVHLARIGKNKAGTGDDIYVVSIFIENYKCDLFKDIQRRNNLPVTEKKPDEFGVTDKSQEQIRKAFFKEDGGFKKYENFAKVTVPALRGDEFDMHTANIGLKGDNQLVRIDLAGAWRGICKHLTLRPNSASEHPFWAGPTNRFAQYDDSLKINAEFVDELDNDVNHDYDKTIRSSIMDLTEFYDAAAFKELAEWVGIKASAIPKTSDLDFLADFIATKVIQAYEERGKDMSRYSAQIKLDLCLKKTDENNWKFDSYQDINGNKVSFKDVVKTHQDYFKEVVCGTKQFKFRDAAHTGDKFLIEAVRIEALRMFSAEIVGNVALMASLSQFSGQKITTPDSAFQALKKCNLSQVKLVLNVVSLK